MACFSLGFLEQLLIWAIIIGAVFALVRLILPMALGPLGAPGSTLIAALNIVLWAAVCIVVVVIIFQLIACLLGGPLLFHR